MKDGRLERRGIGSRLQTNEVLGVSMIAHNAEKVIHDAAMALYFHAKLHDFIDLLHV